MGHVALNFLIIIIEQSRGFYYVILYIGLYFGIGNFCKSDLKKKRSIFKIPFLAVLRVLRIKKRWQCLFIFLAVSENETRANIPNIRYQS